MFKCNLLIIKVKKTISLITMAMQTTVFIDFLPDLAISFPESGRRSEPGLDTDVHPGRSILGCRMWGAARWRSELHPESWQSPVLAVQSHKSVADIVCGRIQCSWCH